MLYTFAATVGGVVGLIIGLLVGANNSAKVKEEANQVKEGLEAEIVKLKDKVRNKV